MPFRRLALAVFACALPAIAGATVVIPAEFREIVNGSDIIAYGRVVETVSVESADRARVDTQVTFEVGTYLKGAAAARVVFTVPGGTVGRYRSVMVGAPRFAPGDEAVVFLTREADGRTAIYGFNQGVFRVRLDEASRRVVVPAALMARGSAPETVVRGAAGRGPLGLEAFGAQVQTVIAEKAAGAAR